MKNYEIDTNEQVINVVASDMFREAPWMYFLDSKGKVAFQVKEVIINWIRVSEPDSTDE